MQNIIFDLGGVLLNLDYPELQKGLSELGIRQKPFASDLHVLSKFETGAISSDEFLTELGKIAHPGIENEALINVWNSILLDFPAKRVEMLQYLGHNYRIFLLSNINELHAPAFERNFRTAFPEIEFHSLFEKTYYSCRVGLRKPDPEIFRLVLSENNLIAEETLFVDDVLENIHSAETLRIRTLYIDLENGMCTEDALKSF